MQALVEQRLGVVTDAEFKVAVLVHAEALTSNAGAHNLRSIKHQLLDRFDSMGGGQ